MDIQRQIHVDAPPARVAAALSRCPYRDGMRIVPSGAGTRVRFDARIEPQALAEVIEADAVATICSARHRLERTERGRRTGRGWRSRHQFNRPTTQQGKKKMTTVTKTVTIDAPTPQVWEAVANIGSIATWNPNVKRSQLTSDQPGGLGATRECQLAPLGTVQERVTSWDEGRSLGIEIYERKNIPGLRQGDATIEIVPTGDSSHVTIELNYEVGLGALGAGMNAVGMKRRFTKAVTGMLAGLKHHVETGESVDGKTKIPVAAVAHAA